MSEADAAPTSPHSSPGPSATPGASANPDSPATPAPFATSGSSATPAASDCPRMPEMTWAVGYGLEPGDAYEEGPYVVFTAQYHRRRGYCCHSNCRHCPFRVDHS